MQYILAVLALGAAVRASPIVIRQAVTASIAPTGTAPAGCSPTFVGSFGIAVKNITQPTAASKRQVQQTSDGQPQVVTVAHVSMITDGQIQGGMHTVTMMPVAQITDGQIQNPVTTVAAVTEFSDGQPQAPKITVAPVSQISDGQPQATKVTSTVAPVSQISDGQPQATTAVPKPTSTVAPVSQITDAQPQGPTATGTTSSAPAASSSAAASGSQMVSCATNGTLELSLANGILKDSKGRTGYIASNFQFQFDDPPQAGAIFTAGFSVCANGSLALGGSNVFYQCLSGNFYNLYNKDWAAQCSPVTIETVMLVNCTS